jgi:hypothetical protein
MRSRPWSPASQERSTAPINPVLGGPAQPEKWLTRAARCFARTLRSKNVTDPKKVRKMNDIKAYCAIKNRISVPLNHRLGYSSALKLTGLA